MRSALRPPMTPRPGIELNRASPLARRLVGAWVPAATPGIVGRGKAGGIMRDLTFGNHAEIIDLDMVTNPTFGIGVYNDGTAGDWARPPLHPSYSESGFASFAAWVRPTVIDGIHQVFSGDGYPETARCWQWRLLSNGKMHIHFWNSAGAYCDLQGTTTLVAGTTYHIAVTWDGAVVTHYLNGVADGSANHAGTALQTLQAAPWIGDGNPPFITSPWKGEIGPLLFWRRGLTAHEVWQLWHPATRWSLFTPPIPSRTYAVLGATPPAGRRRSWATVIGG